MAAAARRRSQQRRHQDRRGSVLGPLTQPSLPAAPAAVAAAATRTMPLRRLLPVVLLLLLGACAVVSAFLHPLLPPRSPSRPSTSVVVRSTASVDTTTTSSGGGGSELGTHLPPSGHLPFLAAFGSGSAGCGGCAGDCAGCADEAATRSWSPSSLATSSIAAMLAVVGGAKGTGAPATGAAAGGQQQKKQHRPAPSQRHHRHEGPVHVVAVVKGSGARAPRLDATWVEVMEHMGRRMRFVDADFALHVVTTEEVLAQGGAAALAAKLPAGVRPDIVYLLGLDGTELEDRLQSCLRGVSNVLALGCGPALRRWTRIGPARPQGRLAALWRALPLPTRRKKLLTLFETCAGFYDRGHSDDLLFMILVVINAQVRNIPSVSEILKPVTLQALGCMLRNCGQQIVDCQRNPVCKAALNCLERCAPNDQVCRYRCIVQYETEAFSAFALCILQKHNCLQNHASIPMQPDPQPITHFRGEPLTHELAEEISYGWLGSRPWSWKVIAGQNPAYDFFPSQHMTYYKKARQLWYQPVFQVITHDGQEVWRRRLYRVRRGPIPGSFYYSVLDNGVTSSEYWRILDVAEDLSWILFFYSGAAAAAGQSYSGAILASATGDWPPGKEGYIDRIHAALDRAAIKPWELFMVRHGHNSDAPLAIDPLAEQRFHFPNSTAAEGAARVPAEGYIEKADPLPEGVTRAW